MKNELEQMGFFIKVDINPIKLKTSTGDSLKTYISYAEEEKLRVCNVILTQVYELNLCQKAEAYIQLHQAALSNLTDTVQQYSSGVISEKLRTFYTSISNILDAIATNIQVYHNKYIDQDLTVPQTYNKLLQDNLVKAIKEIKKTYKDCKAELPLLEIALKPLKAFLLNPNRISFRKALYFQELSKDLIEVKEHAQDAELNKKLHELLHRINFNGPEYIYYCTSALDRKLGEEESQQKKLELLQWYIKTINQQPLKEGLALFPNLPPVCKTMLIWINEEYQFLATHKSDLNGSNVSNTSIKKATEIKINMSLSVPRIAVLLKIFILKGIIKNESQIEVIRFVAANLTSLKAEEISEESLRKCYYNIEPGAINAIREIFNDIPKMLDEL